MGRRFAEIAFTPAVRAVQERLGSRAAYARMEGRLPSGDALGPDEAAFVGARDSFYMATVGETGWPYVQHRGGPPGFVRVLDERTLGFADFRGNRQYVSVGNLARDDRVALILVDYPSRARLKVLGRASVVEPERREILDRLEAPEYGARVERGILIRVEAFDWNCQQHITPRFTPAEIEEATEPLRRRIAELEARPPHPDRAPSGRTGQIDGMDMRIERTKADARRFYEHLNRALRSGDASELDAVIAPDAVDHDPVPGMKQGLEGIKAAFAEGRAAFPDLVFTVEDVVAEGDKVACRLSCRATHRGTFMGVPATGKQVTQTGIDILRFEGGKLIERWGRFDDLGLLAQLGIVPR